MLGSKCTGKQASTLKSKQVGFTHAVLVTGILNSRFDQGIDPN